MTERDELSALDWIGFTVAALGVLWSGVLIPLVFAPRFAQMFADFGGRLPAFTLLVLKQWPPMLASMIPMAMLGMAAAGDRPVATRRRLIVAAFVAGGALVGVLLWGLYLPIFELAGKIQ